MGFHISYIAAPMDPEVLAERLGLTLTGDVVAQPVDVGWWVAKLADNAWSVLWSEDLAFGARARERIAALSREVDVIHCEVAESAMWSSAEYWSKGRPLWRVAHNGGAKGPGHLEASGELPTDFGAIRGTYFARQDREDRGEGPGLVMRSIGADSPEEDLALVRLLGGTVSGESVEEPMRADFGFEIPLELAAARIGFRHDRDPMEVSGGYYVVRPEPPPR